MKYEDFLKANDPNDAGEPVSVDIHTWETDGTTIIGELKDIQPFEGGAFEQKCNRYLFKTDKGLISTILGASIDKQIQPEKYIGRVLCVTFKGQIILKDNKKCNRFTVVDVTDAFKHWEQKPISVEETMREVHQKAAKTGIFDRIGGKNAKKDDQTLGEAKVGK
jgi:hypothetical protein